MKENKMPAFQFYPGDWLQDTSVRACSLEARGLWIEMLCLMHQGEPYGHLTIGGHAMDLRTLSRLVGADFKRTSRCITELSNNGVFSQTKDGIIYSRRMVKDAYLRAIRAKAGSLGGKTTGQILLKQMSKQSTEQTTPPSSSSSSSRLKDPHTPQSGEPFALANSKAKTERPRATGINPRATGTNPRAIAKKAREAMEVAKIKKLSEVPAEEDLPGPEDFDKARAAVGMAPRPKAGHGVLEIA